MQRSGLASFKVLFRHFHGRTGKNYKTTTVKVVGVWAQISYRDLPNTKQKPTTPAVLFVI
jgi:hypothetical protein